MAESFTLNVNGETHVVEAEPDMPLLYALKNDLDLRGPKFGCGLAQCGACNVLIDGMAVRSCVTPIDSVAGSAITTLDGIGTEEAPHPVQVAFIAEEVPQCGYCSNGWIMTTVAMLEKNPVRSEAEIREGLAGLKCRCGTHMAILRAVRSASETMRG
jgi:aerobic-type carbon monoxide dehydrogenase small subunit (CoxS/CutS family)